MTEPGISYADTIRAWLSLNWQPVEAIAVPRLIRPEKRRQVRQGEYKVIRPAQYAHDKYSGWDFPRTVRVMTGYQYHTDAEVWSWVQRTAILTDGRVMRGNEFLKSPFQGVAYRLIVEMARKMFTSRGQPWKGPAENWDT